MKPHHFIMLGLFFDIIGAFLVSVEAIKIKNLKTLREKILGPIHKFTLSPKIEFVDDKIITYASKRYVSVFMSLHYIAGFIVVLCLNELLDNHLFEWFAFAIIWILEKQWYIIVVSSVAFVIFGMFMGLWLIGELIHMALTRFTKLMITILDFVEAKTPDGTVGITGFFLLLIGFVLQLWGSYLGRNY